jgi:two-component system response regulator AtoC
MIKPINKVYHILVIDDEEGMRVSLKELLEKQGFLVSTAESAKKAFNILQNEKIDLIICDIVMPDMSGLLFLSKIDGQIPVVMITAYASIETARRAFKSGAYDYLVKPFEIDELLVVINQCLFMGGKVETEAESRFLLRTKNTQFMKVLEIAEKFSSTDVPVMILGESGTGKEVIADYIYEKSTRKGLPYIKINCAAIPETLLESELFGHEKGAFTGAYERKIGKLEEANGGVILFDEICDMNMSLQAKLLRVLQDFEFTRVGGRQNIHIDCRVITASNKDFYDLILENKFREDLYHRLNGVSLYIPPLRDRIEDIEDLSIFFLRVFLEKYHKNIEGFDDETLSIFKKYSWPGNIRELKNCIERAVVICDGGFILPKHLPDSVYKKDNADSYFTHLSPHSIIEDYRENYTRNIILDVLKRVKGNKTEAAKILKVSRKTLYKWLEEHNIKHEYI